jgi:DNA polymerase-4
MTRRRPEPEVLHAVLEVDQLAAQALAAYRLDLRRKAFAVVRQNAESHKAVVCACSPLARQAGVTAGVPVFVMRRKLGNRVLILGREPGLERRLVGEMHAALYGRTPEVEVSETGRCLLNLSGTPAQRVMSWDGLLVQLRRDVASLGVEEVAIGLSRSPLVAKLLARRAKPDGGELCESGREAEFLAEMDTVRLPGLTSACRQRLEKYGLLQVSQVQSLDRPALLKRFGAAEGEKLYTMVRGMDPVPARSRAREVVGESVLSLDINDDYLLAQQVRLAVDRLCDQLRREELTARRLTCQLHYTDNRATQRSAVMAAPTDDFETISAAAVSLFEEAYQRRVGIKTIRVVAARPVKHTGQLDLFAGDPERKRRSLGRAITDIRGRMGFEAVVNATNLGMARTLVASGGQRHAR